MTILKDIFFLLSNIGWLYITRRYMNIFFTNKYLSKNRTVILYLVYFFALTVINPLFPYLFVNIVVALTCIFIITQAYVGKISKKILVTIYIYIGNMVAEMITALFLNIGGLSINSKTVYNNLFINIVILLIVWLETLITQQFVNIKSNIKLPKAFVFTVIIIPIATMTLEFFIMYNQGFNQTIRFVSMICVMASNFILIYLFDSYSMIFKDHAQTEIVKRERDYYHEQSELLQNNNENLRMFRHDIKNRLISLNALISNKKYDLAIEQVESLTEHLDNVSSFSKSGNFAIDSIVNYKLSRAAQMGVNVSCEIRIPSNMAFCDDDMVIILGNLLDNAIEACQKVEENPYIHLNIVFDRNSLLIHVENNYSEPLNIINNKIHTTKSDTTIHGIGLKSIATIVNKYEGCVDYNYENNVFTATVFIISDGL